MGSRGNVRVILSARESLKILRFQQVGWLCWQSEANQSPVPIFPVLRERTGNIRPKQGFLGVERFEKQPQLKALALKFPTRRNREFFRSEQGISGGQYRERKTS